MVYQLSASLPSNSHHQAFEADCTDFVTIPVDLMVLKARVDAAVKLKTKHQMELRKAVVEGKQCRSLGGH